MNDPIGIPKQGLDDMALTRVVSRLLEQELHDRAAKIGADIAEKAAAELRKRLLAESTEVASNVRSKIKVAALQALDPRQIKIEVILQFP